MSLFTRVLMFLFLSFLGWPWVVGCVDFASIALVGEQLSRVEWNLVHGFWMIAWPPAWGILFITLASKL